MLRFPDRDLAPRDPERQVLDVVAARLGVAPDGVALVGSMAEYVAQGLALVPQVRDVERQQALTDRFLAPAPLEAFFLALRAGLDPALRQARPSVNGAAYPLGQCLEIAEAALAALDTEAPARLPGGAAEGWAALQAFRAAGGEVRRAWGDLRGEYFQNALVVGTLYVDVANDAVVVTKPPVDIRPLAEADFHAIADHLHYARIGGRYWKRRYLPNHLLPELAPYAPLIEIGPNGAVRLGPLDTYMLALTLAGRFASSARALAAPALPPAMFDGLRAALLGGPSPVASDPAAGRAAALAACRRARHDCATSFNSAATAVREANRRLARLLVRAAA
jgi:hypothetical protein